MTTQPYSETRRQIEHLVPIAFAFLLPYMTWLQALGLALLSIFYALFGSQWLVRGTHRPEEQARRFSLGKVSYGLSVFLLILFFHDRMFVVGAVWANLAIGDSLSNILGRRWGRSRLPWNREKTWVGLATFLVSGILGGALLIAWIGAPADQPGISLSMVWGYAILTATVCALTESFPAVVNDNLSLTFVGGTVLYVATYAGWPGTFEANLFLHAILVNVVLGALGFLAKSVRFSGWAGGVVIGSIIYYCVGFPGYSILLLFFVLGSAASKLGYRQKRRRGIAQQEGGRRGASHAIANCLVGVLCAIGIVLTPLDSILMVAFVGAFATATFDTVATEVGQWLGKHPMLLFPPRAVPPGTEGAVSLEGSLAGLLGGLSIVSAAIALELVGRSAGACILFGAVLGAMVESALGAANSEALPLRNEILNLTNTVVGATASVLFVRITG